MPDLTTKIRYYPGDLPASIRLDELERLGEQIGVRATVEEIKNPQTIAVCGEIREETMDVPMEEISQVVVTVEPPGEEVLRRYLVELFGRVKSPRTAYAFWGSSPDGERIARATAETNGGW
jgi:hypothetical protein